MNTSVLTVEKCEEMLSNLKKIEHIAKTKASPSHYQALERVIKDGEKKEWKSFIKRIMVDSSGYEEYVKKEIEQFLSIVTEAMQEPAKFNIELAVRCVTIRDVKVTLKVYWKNHPFFTEKTLLEQTIVSIPTGYFRSSKHLKSRRPFIKTSRGSWKGYEPNSDLLFRISSFQQLGELPPLVPTSTLYTSAESVHTLTYTSYGNRLRPLSVVDRFFGLFAYIRQFLEGTPTEAVILQDISAHMEGIYVYPDGKYLSPEEYPVIEE